jgi:hypothetical protein
VGAAALEIEAGAEEVAIEAVVVEMEDAVEDIVVVVAVGEVVLVAIRVLKCLGEYMFLLSFGVLIQS